MKKFLAVFACLLFVAAGLGFGQEILRFSQEVTVNPKKGNPDWHKRMPAQKMFFEGASFDDVWKASAEILLDWQWNFIASDKAGGILSGEGQPIGIPNTTPWRYVVSLLIWKNSNGVEVTCRYLASVESYEWVQNHEKGFLEKIQEKLNLKK
jgi:hypothetical protein